MNFNFSQCTFELSGPFGPTGQRGAPNTTNVGPGGQPGMTGMTGATGERGNQGPDGTRGSLIDFGTSDPSFSFSNSQGDIYLNTSTHDLFRFEEGYWVEFLHIRGHTGERGETGPLNFCDDPTPSNTFLLFQKVVNASSFTSSSSLNFVTPGNFGVNGVIAQLTPPFSTITVTWKVNLSVAVSPSTITLVTNIYTNEMMYDGEERSRIVRTLTASVSNFTLSSTFDIGTTPELNPIVLVIPKWSVTSGTLSIEAGGYFITEVH